MKPRLLFFLTIFSLQSVIVFSQTTANYTFSNATTGSLTDMSTGATNVLVPTSVTGDFASTVYPIGFDFWLMGTRYEDFSVNSNGLMRLGKTAVANTSANSLATGTNLPLLTAFWDNLNSYSTSSTSKVRFKVTGTAPNRILTVEWKDFVISNNSSSSTQLSTWQIRLYETSGMFEYVYGTMQIATGSSAVTASIGMTNSNANNGLIYVTSISSPAVLRTTAGVVNNLVNSSTVGNITNLNSAIDGSRVKYAFTSVTPNANPAGLTFTAVGTSSMTLNWTCAATNELGFAIYRSDDGGLTYNFVSQAAANATSSVQGALEPSKTYYWKVYAVTEGALSTAVSGNQATTSCGATAANTMSLTSGGTYNWNTAGNWSLGHVPTACENAVVTFTYTSFGSTTAVVNLSGPVTVNNLTVNGVYGSSFNKALQLLTNNYNLTVLGNLSMSASGGSGSNEVDLLASTGSVVTVKGTATIGQASDTKNAGIGGVAGQSPEFFFKGNVIFNNNSFSSYPGSFYFEGGASQSLTNNASVYTIWFGNADIGSVTNTALTLGGTYAADVMVNGGNLTVNSGSSLVLPYNAAFNQYTSGAGALVLKSNATMKLGDYFGGQTGSNFPASYSTISLDDASTVEYNYTGSSSPIIYTGVVYGNLVLSNASRKYTTSDLYVDGNLTVNTGSTFGSDNGAYIYGSSVINNGIVDGLYSTSRLGFYGNGAQTYSGTGTFGTSGTPFYGVDIFNSSNVTLNAALNVYRVNLFHGTFINSNQFKIGTSSFGLVQRGGSSGYAAGAFDTYPVINSPNNYIVRYEDASALISTGYEIPASTNTLTVYSNNVNGVTLTSNLNVTNDFELLQSTFNIGANTVKIGNVITKLSGNINGSAGTVEMTGTTAQSIPAATFQSNNLKNLIISNTDNATGVTLLSALDIYRSVTFGAGGRKLTTGGYLTFKSTATETAWLGQMTASNSIVGDAAVERYIPLHTKAWQFLSTPITASSTQTVKQAWQEGAATVNGNLVPGYGTQLTSNRVGAASQPTPGFDVYTPSGASIKIYNAATGSYKPLNRTDTAISNPKGYMVLVRGDRSVTTSTATATATIMRTKGTLHTPANPPVTINVATGLESIGNPYASAIDFRSLTISGGVQPDFFYLWDPKLTTLGINSAWGLGGYQTFSWNGSSFDVTPGGGSYTSGNTMIESGQAFFVNAPFAPGTVSFSESAKKNGSNNVNRTQPLTIQQLRTNMYVISSGNRIMLDGNLVQFDRSFSNRVDAKDGIKLTNTGENLGLLRDTKSLSVERRALIQNTDTIFYKLGQVKLQQYELEFIAANLAQPGLEAWLQDNYLHTNTRVDLNDTTRLNFTIINDAGSYATDRFRLVFIQRKQQVNVPVSGLDNKGNISKQADVSAKTTATKIKAGISVYPNPVTDKTMNIQFSGQAAGNYNIQLMNNLGQVVYNGTIQLAAADISRSVKLDASIAAGSYQFVVTANDGTKHTQQLIIQ